MIGYFTPSGAIARRCVLHTQGALRASAYTFTIASEVVSWKIYILMPNAKTVLDFIVTFVAKEATLRINVCLM